MSRHQLQDLASAGARGRTDITHLLIDEVHERDINTDFLLCLIRRVLRSNSTLKVRNESATTTMRFRTNQRDDDYYCDPTAQHSTTTTTTTTTGCELSPARPYCSRVTRVVNPFLVVKPPLDQRLRTSAVLLWRPQ